MLPSTTRLFVVVSKSQLGSVRKFSSGPVKPKEGLKWDDLTFALTPTDFMYVASAKKGENFTKGKLQPYGPLQLYPAATVLNYGQGTFEGIKAFRTSKDRVVIFRPEENWKRQNEGAASFLMSRIPQDVYMDALDSVVKANCQYVPPSGKGALYLRPLLFGDGPQLGVAPSISYLFCVWASPVGNYFKSGVASPINLLASTKQHRAAPKGSGHVKAIGNYAPCFRSQKEAKESGFSEVLYLDARHEKYVEEAGASNIFCVSKDGTIRTPELGAILPGVTRKSVIHLAKENGYKVIEERVSIDQFLDAQEVFCTGTGASITPVGSITFEGKKSVLNNGQVGKVTQFMYETLLSIQHERIPDKYGWLHDPFQSK